MERTRERLVGFAGWSGRFLLDLLLPPQCPTCDAVVDAAGRFCPACFRRADFIVEPCCHRCGVGFGSVGEAGLSPVCGACRDAPPPWRQARAALSYDDFSKRLILPLKYADRTENAKFLAGYMLRAGSRLLRDADLLVPVPLHRRRLFSRRYNQAALLAWHIGRLADRRVMVDGLVRIRATRSLASCPASDRAAVIEGAITCRGRRREALRGKRIVLIDDVLTTGATAGICAVALLEAGAASVDLLVGARAARHVS